MRGIKIIIDKGRVNEEVAKVTDYTGSHLISEADLKARDRILMTDEDQETLDRFWQEACTMMTERLKEWEPQGKETGDDFKLSLKVADAFSKELEPTVNHMLESFAINYITGKWFGFTNREEAPVYLTEASNFMLSARMTLCNRKRPSRPK